MLDVLQSADPVLYFLGLSAALKLSLYYRWFGCRPSQAEYVGQVHECFLYPLKSGRAVSTDKLICSFPEGPHNNGVTDRRWAVVTADNEVVTYKITGRVTTLLPTIEDGCLTLTGLGSDSLRVNTRDVEKHGKTVTFSLHGVNAQGLDCGDVPGAWLDSYLSMSGCRLVYAPPDFDAKRPVITGSVKHRSWTKVAKEEDQVAYQACTPFHIMTVDTLADLNSRLATPVGVDRFRCNFLIKCDGPYSEDTWRDIFIGDTRFTTIKLTGRCSFTTIDPENGKSGPEPLKTLNTYRKLIPEPADFGPCLGIQMVLVAPGTVKIGDPVYVTRGTNLVKP